MIPTLYDKTGTIKIGDLNDCIECFVEEERNGIFELTMIYPANSSILESIVYDNIIVADANDYLKSQKFRVYNTRKLMANRIEVCARHISFDLVHDWVDVISIENQSCEYALNTIFRNSQFSKHFKGYSDIINAQNFKANKATCLEAIGGTSGSIIDTYGTGAEILRDNTDIHVLNRRGHDNDVTIEYRKNLTGLEVEEDTTDLVTRIMPYAIYTNSNNEEVEVRGDFINSPLINNYAHPYVKYIDYSEEFEDGVVPTKTKLNNLATKEYTINKVDIPKCNYKIEFIPLSKCAGYEGLEDRINLCDVVTVKDSRYNIDTQAKVIKVVFDVLRGRYDSMELGEPRTTLGDIIGGTGDGPTQGPPGPPGPPGPAGADGSIGDFPESLPAVPQITAKVYGFANIEISWTFENKVYYSYELYASKTKGFVPNTFNLLFSGQASTFLHQVQPNETWYYRACAINTHGYRTEFSSEVEVNTVKISDLSDYVESAAIGDALIGTLSLDRGWVGQLRGNWIDAKQLSVTDGNGKRTLDIDSFGNVNLDVASLKIKSSGVVIESQLQQMADKLEVKFAESGGYNRVLNGCFKKGIKSWATFGTPTASVVADTTCGYDYSLKIITTAQNQGCQQKVSNLVVGRTYVFSSYVYGKSGVCGIQVNNDGKYSSALLTKSDTWERLSVSFVASATTVTLQLGRGSWGSNGTHYFVAAQLEEGEIANPYSPHSSEIYDGITTIDKDGIEVDCTNADTKTQMTAEGFKVIRKSDNKELFNASNGNLTMEGTLRTSSSGLRVEASGTDYKIYDGNTMKGFFGFNELGTAKYNAPRIYLAVDGVTGTNSHFSLTHYSPVSSPLNTGISYVDFAYYSADLQDYSNIYMSGNSEIKIAPLLGLDIDTHCKLGKYTGKTTTNLAKFLSTQTAENKGWYDGTLRIESVSNKTNPYGLVLADNSSNGFAAVSIYADSNGGKHFRPCGDNNTSCGDTTYRWNAVYSANGAIQTSDERYKMKMGRLDTQDCYNMIKNTDVYKYCMLSKSKSEMSEDEIKKMAKKASKEDVTIQAGVMAQHILDYDCAKYVLTHDSWLDEENNEEKEMYNINPYGFSAVIMGALKEEIDKREALEKRMETLEEEIRRLKTTF